MYQMSDKSKPNGRAITNPLHLEGTTTGQVPLTVTLLLSVNLTFFVTWNLIVTGECLSI